MQKGLPPRARGDPARVGPACVAWCARGSSRDYRGVRRSMRSPTRHSLDRVRGARLYELLIVRIVSHSPAWRAKSGAADSPTRLVPQCALLHAARRLRRCVTPTQLERRDVFELYPSDKAWGTTRNLCIASRLSAKFVTSGIAGRDTVVSCTTLSTFSSILAPGRAIVVADFSALTSEHRSSGRVRLGARGLDPHDFAGEFGMARPW